MVDRNLVERDLDEYLEGESWPAHVDGPDGYDEDTPETPRDVTTAAGILRRLKRLNREAAQINAVADDEVARMNAWRHDRLDGIQRDQEWGERALEAFMRNHHEVSRKKSLPLADGRLQLRDPSKAGKIVVDDEAALIAWAKAHDAVSADPDNPMPVNLKPTVSKTLIGQWYQTGTEPIAVTLDDEGQEAKVFALLGPDGAIPGISRVVAVASKFSVTLGED